MADTVGRVRWRAAQAGQKRAQVRKRARLKGAEQHLVAGALRGSARMEQRLAARGARTDGVVVEVGSGAHGLIWGWPRARRVAIDPLASFFAAEFDFLQRGAGIAILEARGEELPLASGSVDVLLSDNVLDHAEAPARILAEIERVLAPGGLAFVSVDTHHFAWGIGARLYNALGELTGRYPNVPAFPNHPFHFTLTEVDRLLARTRLELVERVVPPRPRVGRLSAKRPYDLLKRVFFKNRRVELLLRARG